MTAAFIFAHLPDLWNRAKKRIAHETAVFVRVNKDEDTALNTLLGWENRIVASKKWTGLVSMIYAVTDLTPAAIGRFSGGAGCFW
jgi:hypothetical protein